MLRVLASLLVGTFVLGSTAGCGDDDPTKVIKKEGRFMDRTPGGKGGDGKAPPKPGR